MPSPIPVPTLIASSMRLIGAIASGEDPTPEEIDDALLTLNDLLENWSTEKLSVWGAVNESFSLVQGQATYTIGTGGDFNTNRPVYVNGGYTTVNSVDTPVHSMTQGEYNLITLKSLQNTCVERMLYVNDFPLGRLTFWPVPSASVMVTLSLSRLLSYPVTALDSLTGPPGFLKALRYALAIELAPEFGTEASETVILVAADAKADYKKSNMTDVVARYDNGMLDCYDDYQRRY